MTSDVTTDDETRLAGDMTLVDHLRELRDRLVRSALAILIGALLGWIFYERIFDFLTLPYCDAVGAKRGTCALTSFDPLEPFGFRAQVAAYSGIFFALPVIFYQLWRFIAPGLYRCLLYTSDAADDLLCVDLGGRRIIKKKHNIISDHISTFLTSIHFSPLLTTSYPLCSHTYFI